MNARDLYGFSGFDRDQVDDRHLLLCPGCNGCLRDDGGPYDQPDHGYDLHVDRELGL